jgi:hypothetical protein
MRLYSKEKPAGATRGLFKHRLSSPAAQSAYCGGRCRNEVSAEPARVAKPPLYAKREIVAGVTDLCQAAGIDVMGVLIAVLGEQAGLIGDVIFHAAQGLPTQHGRAAVIAKAVVDIGIDRTQAGAAIELKGALGRQVIDQVGHVGIGLQPRVGGMGIVGLIEHPVGFHRKIGQIPVAQIIACARTDIESGVHVVLGAVDIQTRRKSRTAQNRDIGVVGEIAGLSRSSAEQKRNGGSNK